MVMGDCGYNKPQFDRFVKTPAGKCYASLAKLSVFPYWMFTSKESFTLRGFVNEG
jgi:hypothetical protein